MTSACLSPVVTTLFGWDNAPHIERVSAIEVLGVPSDFGNAYVSGARHGPAAIRAASGSAARPRCMGRDLGDIVVSDGADWPTIVARTRMAVETTICAGGVPLLLGGDHAISFAAVAALAERGPLDIVWFDAHTDFCPWSSTEPHNHKQVLRRISTLSNIGRMLVIGHRGLTYFDETLQASRLDVCTADGGPIVFPRPWLDAGHPVYISIDIDAIDPCVAPGTGHPVPGGLDVATACELIHIIAAHRKVVGLDLTEVNPLLDYAGMTANVATTILATAIDAVTNRGDATHASHSYQVKGVHA